MRIALANVTSGGLSGGYSKYLLRMLPRLRGHPRVSALAVFLPEAARPLVGELDGVEYGPGGDSPWLREAVARARPDVLFVPTARLPRGLGVPAVVMVRNMEPLVTPFGGNPLGEGLRNLARRWAAKRACRSASRVIAVSRFVRDFLVGRWGIPEGKVGLVYHGVEPRVDEIEPRALKERLARPFFFTAGSVRPARGLEDLVGALGRLAPADRAWDLVIAGGVDPGQEGYRDRLEAAADAAGVKDRLVWAGRLSAGEMSWALGRCRGFVMTSRTEACPNTALEAMAAGVAVVSTDAAPMPEFFKDVAIYYRARDAASLAGALRAADGLDAGRREAVAAAARARAAEFTWEACAERTVEELGRAAGAPLAGS